MKYHFDPSYPPEQLTAAFWEAVILDAFADWLLREMDKGRIAPPGAFDD